MARTMEWFLILIAGMAFGAWPLITRGSKLHFLPAGLGLQLGTVLMFGLFIVVMRDQLDLGAMFSSGDGGKLALLALLAGLVNGVGQLAMQKLVASPTTSISVFAPATLTVMAVVYAIGGWLAYNEPMTIRKVVGMATAMITFWLLKGA